MTTMRGDDEWDVAGFTAAFQTLFPRAVRLARRIVGERAAAEDVAAEAMARAYAAWDQIGRSDGYRTGWVLRVTTNLAIDAVRRRDRPLAGSADRQLESALLVGDDQEAMTLRVALMAALRQLPRRQREAIALRYLAGLSQLEVAEALGVRPGTIATHVNRGLTGLRNQLRELAPKVSEVDVVRGLKVTATTGGRMRIRSLEEAAELRGTGSVLRAHVTGVMPGGWGWTVDVGIPAVLLRQGHRGESREEPATLVGHDVDCEVVAVDLEQERMVVAIPGAAAAGTDDDRRREEIVRRLRPGDTRTGHVHGLVPFGVFVDIGGVHGLVHSSELGKGVVHPEELLHVGQRVEVSVLDVDVALRRVALRLTSVPG